MKIKYQFYYVKCQNDPDTFSIWLLREANLQEKKIFYSSPAGDDTLVDTFWHKVIWPENTSHVSILTKQEAEELLFLGSI